MNEHNLSNYVEPLIVSLYLIFIFLSVQIWFLWKDIDKKESKIKSFFNDAFFKKNCIYVYSFSAYFIANVFFQGTNIPASYLKALELLAFICLVLFAYDWYSMLGTCRHKRHLPQELVNLHNLIKKI